MLFFLCCLCCFLLFHQAASWVNPGLYDRDKRLHLVSPRKWNELKPDALWLKWTHEKMFGSCSMDLLGYTESTAKMISKIDSPYSRMASASFVADMKEAKVNVLDLGFKCIATATDNPCALYHMGFFEMRCKAEKTLVLISPLIPLGWLVHQYYETIKWDTWAHSHCLNWYYTEDPNVRSAISSVHCHPLPVYAEASAAEFGYFELQHPNFTWSRFAMFSKESTQTINIVPAGQKCYLSTVDSKFMEAQLHASPVAVCCYAQSNKHSDPPKKTDWAFLFKEIEQPDDFMVHGSSAFRSHPAGVETFGANMYLPGQVPILSHWYWDLLPYRYCCVWWSGATCSDFYHKARPTPKVQRPKNSYKTAFMLGNVIAYPFEATPFMCGDIGEYWLLKNDVFRLSIKADLVSKNMDNMEYKKSPKRAMSSGTFVTEIAIQVSSIPHLIFQFINDKQRYKSLLYVIDTKRNGVSVMLDKMSGMKFFGFVGISDENVDVEGLSITTVALSAKNQQLGLTVMRPRFGQEFASILVQAARNISATTGLLGDISAGSGGSTASGKKPANAELKLNTRVTYSDSKCSENLVPKEDSLFAFVPKPKVPAASSVSQKNKSPGKSQGKKPVAPNQKSKPKPDQAKNKNNTTTKTAPKPKSASTTTTKKVTKRTTKKTVKLASRKLSFGTKSLSQAKDIACLATRYQFYCDAIETSLLTIKSRTDDLMYYDPSFQNFRFCTRLPDVRGVHVKRFEHMENVGLSAEQIMPITCSHPFTSTKDYDAVCKTKGKDERFPQPGSFACQLPSNVQKSDNKAEGFFKGNNGTTIYNQHVEGNNPRRIGRRGLESDSKARTDGSGVQLIVANSWLLVGTLTMVYIILTIRPS